MDGQGSISEWLDGSKNLKKTDPGDFENPGIDEQHDILYACFQNIFSLRDWLHHDGEVSNKLLNAFINENIEMQVCRDIANGTKHFNLSQASIDDDFTIIREYEPFHKILEVAPNRIVVLAGGHKFELKELAYRCIQLWEQFIKANNLINRS